MKAPELKERLEESEKLIQEMTVTWEDKLRKTEAIAQVTHTHRQTDTPSFSWRDQQQKSSPYSCYNRNSFTFCLFLELKQEIKFNCEPFSIDFFFFSFSLKLNLIQV